MIIIYSNEMRPPCCSVTYMYAERSGIRGRGDWRVRYNYFRFNSVTNPAINFIVYIHFGWNVNKIAIYILTAPYMAATNVRPSNFILFFIFILSSRFDSKWLTKCIRVCVCVCVLVRECDVFNLFTSQNYTDWMSYWAMMWHRSDVCIDTVVSTPTANLTFILSHDDFRELRLFSHGK